MINLAQYKQSYKHKVGLFKRCSWYFFQHLFFTSFVPGSYWRSFALRLFGANIEKGVVLKSRIKIKFPWLLDIGENSWIGEGVHIDNLAKVKIGRNCCVSQYAYLCTGNHNWNDKFFSLIIMPITIENGSWIAARCVIGPGVIVKECSILALGSVAVSNLDSYSIYAGNPAKFVKKRNII
jgi:putative colanic acid biosynthesis acetyltransferase WcaF